MPWRLSVMSRSSSGTALFMRRLSRYWPKTTNSAAASCPLITGLLAGPEATNDLLPIRMDVFADKDTLGGKPASEFRGKGLEVEAAACEVKHVRERTTRQLQQPLGTVHVGWQLLQKTLEGVEVHRRSRFVGKGLNAVLAMCVVDRRCTIDLTGGVQPCSVRADAGAEE